MHDLEALANRLRKTYKTRKSWAKREGIEAYRLYDMDIPELRYVVDVYGDQAVVYDRRGNQEPDDEALDRRVLDAVAAALAMPMDRLHLKRRRRQEGGQYEKLGETRRTFPVQEGAARYLVNLDDYLDTGLFLDHRPLRRRFRETLPPGTRFLNLFCYTGAVSVAAAQAGAVTTSVDMSNTYLDWARDNFRLNDLDPAAHRFVREDALRFLAGGPSGEPYDVVFLDPPTASKSKKMTDSFDVQRDHVDLLRQTMRFVKPDGRLYFSTNRQRFVLDPVVSEAFDARDITRETIPDDFRNAQIHKCWVISPRP